jgi:MFS family permease
VHDEDLLPRSRVQLLLGSAVGPLALGKVLSTLAVWTTNVAGAILVFELTGSATFVGAVSAAQFLPQLVLTPFSGARADRSDRLHQLMAGTAVTALGSVLLVVWSLTVGFATPRDAAAVVAAAGLVGVGFSLSGPATSSLLPSLVRRSELADAIALNSLPIIVARAAGPAVGALLFLTLGGLRTFAIASLLHLGFLLTLVGLRGRLRVTRPTSSTDGDQRVRAGWHYLRGSRSLQLTLVGVGTIGVGVDPVITLTPALAASLGASPALVGTLASAFGLGTAVGFVVLTRARLAVGIHRLGALGLTVIGVGLLAAAAAPAAALAVAGFGLSGVGMTFALNSFTTLVQRDVPDALRGRVMALWAMAFLGSRPLTATIGGIVADLISVQHALLLAALVVLAGARVTRRANLVGPAPRPTPATGATRAPAVDTDAAPDGIGAQRGECPD